jgi:ATP adenylyltransferase
MKRLWAPWRMQYLVGVNKVSNCIFCDKAADNRDRDNLVVLRGETGFVMLNLYPYSNGHLMVVPYQHASSLEELPANVQAELMTLVSRCLGLLRRTMNPQGFNVGINIGKAAGAGFDDHVHIHIVPRWLGDTNFMPVIGETRTIPELLPETYDRLRAALDAAQPVPTP